MNDRYSLDEAQLLFAKRANCEAWKLLEKATHSHNASIYFRKAKSASEKIDNAEDKALFLSDLASGDWNGFVLENERNN